MTTMNDLPVTSSTRSAVARTFASAMVIARRDYIATVWSRSFLLFLLGPMIALGFGGLLGHVGGQVDEAALRPVVAVVATPAAIVPFKQAYDRLEQRVGTLPQLQIEAPQPDRARQVRALLTASHHSAGVVLTGWPDAPRLSGPARQLDRLAPDVEAIVDEVALTNKLAVAGLTRPDLHVRRDIIDPARGGTSAARHVVARGAQTTLFMLTILLAGMLLSNVVEEKSNKVIEVLAAAVPVDAIFLGKLMAMLAMSLTGIALWGSLIGGLIMMTLPQLGPLPMPAVGWPAFALLGALYFVMNYMIIGGLFLGIGSQAASVREVQTLSMPVTMMQLAIFALGSSVLGDLDSPLGIFAAVLPVSSPLTMVARGAEDAALWPHLLALGWQALWVAVIIRFAARRFRIGVLKSGNPPRKGWWPKRQSRAIPVGAEATVS